MDLSNRIADYCEKNNIFGVVRVTVKDEIKLSESYGFADKENKIPFTDNSMFSFYSLSKPFCAMGLLKLCDKNLVDITAHPSVCVPEAEGFHKELQIKHLLHHVSGLPDFEQTKEFCENHKPGYSFKMRDHVKRLTAYEPLFTPGSDGMYANVNFVLCALIIENVSGMKYSDYMKKEIFEPLSMKTALVDDENTVIENRVSGYELVNDIPTKCEKSHDWMFGAGDIVGTADDVYALNKAIKNKLILKSETWEKVLTPSMINSMGMGCTVSEWHGKKRITHNGGHTGFRTLHVQLPTDDFDIIILSNSGYGNARFDIAEMIYESFYGDNNENSDRIEMDKGYIV